VRSYVKVSVRNNLLSVENIRSGTCAAPNAAVRGRQRGLGAAPTEGASPALPVGSSGRQSRDPPAVITHSARTGVVPRRHPPAKQVEGIRLPQPSRFHQRRVALVARRARASSSADAPSEKLRAACPSAARSAPRFRILDPRAAPPEAIDQAEPGSWDAVHPPRGYRVVLLTAGDDPHDDAGDGSEAVGRGGTSSGSRPSR
jgi:hypothetical protein